MARRHDIAVYGATGRTGAALVDQLVQQLPAGASWCVAGRDEVRLRALVAERAPGATVRVVPVDDPSTLRELLADTEVLIDATGPDPTPGDALVSAAVDARTHVVSLSADPVAWRARIDRHHDEARARGVRLVMAAGTLAVPSDLAALLAARALSRRGTTARRIEVLHALRGRLPRATLATTARLWSDPDARRQLADPRLLCPPGHRGMALDEIDPVWPERHEPSGRLLAPFVLSGVGTRVVRRSAALYAQQGEGYGEQLVYREGLRTRRRREALALTLAQRVGRRLLAQPRLGQLVAQWLAARRLDPTRPGFVSTVVWGTGDDGRQVHGVVSVPGEPGRRATATFATAVALCLVERGRELPDLAGVLTPATAAGEALVGALRRLGATVSLGDA